MANEAIDLIVTKQAREELVKTREEVVKLDAEFIKLANDINAFQGKRTPFPKLPKDYEERLKQSSSWTAQLNANNKEAERLAAALARQKAKLAKLETENAKALAKERLETQILNKALKDEAVLSSKLVGEYQKLTVRRNQAANAIKNEIALNGKNSEALGRLRAEFSKLDKKYVAANRATRDFRDNVGNYKSALGGATGALRSFVGVFGIYSGLQIAREVYDQIKAIDGMTKALKQVTQTQEAFNQAQFFLKQTAEESGANIIGLTSSYTKFLASAKTTNLTLDQTQNIFRQVSKAAGVLGLSTDDTNGAFRALEQILSKGKVQAEEIRGQLGERLPGAFQILAKSMGLTTAELSKQLELGNVLSEEVLPGFAKQLEETYSLDKVERVETLAAAQNRLSNAWTEFLQAVEGGEGTLSRVIGGMLELITNSVKGFSILFKSVEQLNDEFDDKTKAKAYKDELDSMQGAAADLGQTLKQVASRNFFDYTKSLEKAREEVARIKKEREGIAKQIDVGRGVFIANPEYEKYNKLLEEANTELALRQGRLDAVNSVLRKNTDETEENTKEIEKNTKAKEKNIDLTPRLNKIDGISFVSTNKLENQRDKLFKDIFGGLDFKAFDGTATGEIDGIERIFRFYKDAKITLGADAIKAPDTDEFEAALIRMAQKAEEASKGIADEWERNAKKMEDVFSGTFSTFEQFYGLDLDAFKDLLAGKEASLDSYSNMFKSITQALFESQLIKYEKEQQANKQMLDAILQDENASDKKKEQARKEFNEREAEINRKKAKAQKDAALVQIAIDTATAIVKALPNFALAAAVAGFGALQSAIVANTQIPAFKDGTENAPAGLAITDEEGPELRIGRDGRIKSLGSTKGARFQKLDKGDIIKPAKETSEIYKQAFISNQQIEQDKIDMAIMRSIALPLIDSKEIGSAVERAMMKYVNRPNVWNGTILTGNKKPSRYHV